MKDNVPSSNLGVHAVQHVVPTGPWFAAQRTGNYEVNVGANCHSVVNPVIDVQPYLPNSLYKAQYGYFEDPHEIDLYNKTLHETNLEKQHKDMFDFVKYVMGTQAHTGWLLWWYRRVPLRSYVNGWKIGPSHYINQDLSTIWLSAPECGKCTTAPAASG